jgi:pilus assembly protein CpaC
VLASAGLNLNVTLNALEAKGLLRTLADPNLTTLSGGSASFLAGGQVPIRVPDANGNATVTYKNFGVQLNFTPVVLDGKRIQIRLTPEVSDVASFTAAGDPVFTTRTLDATVELRDGQSFSVAGLMQSHDKLSHNQLPWLGDVPVLGALFKSSSFQKDETELVVIVTPRLVQPSGPNQPLSTPFDKAAVANDGGYFIAGQMEFARQSPYKPRGAPKSGYILDLGGSK